MLIKIILIKTILIVSLAGATNYLISDYDFTNRGYSLRVYRNAFSKKLGCYRVRMVYKAARYYKINPTMLFAKLQAECAFMYTTNYLDYYCMGYAIHSDQRKGYDINKNYINQIWGAARCLKKFYREAKRKKYIVGLDVPNKKIKCANRATYSLYQYCPIYKKKSKKFGYVGNYVFPKIYRNIKKILKKNYK